MSSISRRLRGPVALGLAVSFTVGCAQIETRSTVEIMRRDTPSLVLGPPGGAVTARGVEARWSQDGDRLTLRLTESRTCASVRHVPVVRIERVDKRTAGGAMWWEYGLGAGALGLGLAGLIRPEAFSQASITSDGQTIRDTATGYRIGGIFTAIGTLFLTAAVVDTVRTRDEVIYTDAFRREQGGVVECRDPKVPLTGRTVELLVDEWSTVEPTDDEGGVRFLLPTVEQLPPEARDALAAHAQWKDRKAAADLAAQQAAERAAQQAAEAELRDRKGKRRRGKGKAAEPTKTQDPATDAAEPVPELGPAPEPVLVRGVLRIDKARALAVDFLVPYHSEAAGAHQGEGVVEPSPAVDPSPRGVKAADEAKPAPTEGTTPGEAKPEPTEGTTPGEAKPEPTDVGTTPDQAKPAPTEGTTPDQAKSAPTSVKTTPQD